MAAVKSHKPLPLLRRPLPPKSSPLPPIKQTSTVSTSYDSHEINSWSDSQNVYPESQRESRSFRNLPQRNGEPEHFVYGRTQLHTDYSKRGPDPLPARQPRKPREPPPEAIMKETFVKPPPKFTLRDFLRKKRSASLPKVEKMAFPVVSKQNYEKYENFTCWYNGEWEQKTAVHSFDIDSRVNVPDVTPRKPAAQLLIEMKVPSVDRDGLYFPEDLSAIYHEAFSNKVTPITPAVSKSTIYKSFNEHQEPNEMITSDVKREGWELIVEASEGFPEDNKNEKQTRKKRKAFKDIGVKTFAHPTKASLMYEEEETRRHPEAVLRQTTAVTGSPARLTFDARTEIYHYFPEMEQGQVSSNKAFQSGRGNLFSCPEEVEDVLIASSSPTYFQGEALPRTASPFDSPKKSQMSPLEALVLNAMVTESTILNLKAHFISRLPSLLPLADILTHLNASFNDFWVFPQEIFNLKKLESLKLRDNPIKEIPQDIDKLKHLKYLDMSFNLLSSLPTSLFQLKKLEMLDVGYNRLSFLPDEVSNLTLLSSLVLEGNQLGALPNSALRLQLKVLKIGNNFIHPLFWRETTNNQPQRLVDLCAQTVAKSNSRWNQSGISKPLKRFLESPRICDCCGDFLFGEGLRVIKSVGEVFRIKNLPFIFRVCSQTCRRAFVKNTEAVQEWLLCNEITLVETKRGNIPRVVV